MKGEGQWNLIRSMAGKGHVKALIALRRAVTGPRGPPKDSVAADPEEVDALVRAAYGTIYVGNVKDQEKLKEEYFQEYLKTYSTVLDQRRNRSQERNQRRR